MATRATSASMESPEMGNLAEKIKSMFKSMGVEQDSEKADAVSKSMVLSGYGS